MNKIKESWDGNVIPDYPGGLLYSRWAGAGVGRKSTGGVIGRGEPMWQQKIVVACPQVRHAECLYKLEEASMDFPLEPTEVPALAILWFYSHNTHSRVLIPRRVKKYNCVHPVVNIQHEGTFTSDRNGLYHGWYCG